MYFVFSGPTLSALFLCSKNVVCAFPCYDAETFLSTALFKDIEGGFARGQAESG